MTEAKDHVPEGDATRVICEHLTRQLRRQDWANRAIGQPTEGDVDIRETAQRYWQQRDPSTPIGVPIPGHRAAPFYDAAWQLCLRGLLRPGPRAPQGYGQYVQAQDHFSLTQLGVSWVLAGGAAKVFSTVSFVSALEPISGRFGPAFLRRASEAAGCYRSGHYLACCAMAGAAAEAILLSVGAARLGESDALAKYRSSGGRASLLRSLTGSVPRALREEIDSLANSSFFWRDDAAHGEDVIIGDAEANVALSHVLRLAQLVDDRWEVLTTRPPSQPGESSAGQ
jgi:hypothetical protein